MIRQSSTGSTIQLLGSSYQQNCWIYACETPAKTPPSSSRQSRIAEA
ncbi:hypothetical protein [Catenulispora pinisilvae]|nr:hypothetical protein [Catenulispora pinisilvae]